MNSDIYELLPPESCFSKTHGREFFETYNSHVNVCLAFVEPVVSTLGYPHPVENIRKMVEFHDIGKLGHEFQEKIRGGEQPQHIHHSELAFIRWLDGDERLRQLELPYILAILAHHRTLIDEESAIIIERFIANHSKWKSMSEEWLEILKRPRAERMDNTFLSALPLIDILRTIDILASYTTETVFNNINKLAGAKSLFEAGFNDVSKEISCINLKTDEIKFEEQSNNGKTITIKLYAPVKSVIEYVRKEQE